ncbi:bet1-like protein [Gossypium australe]|uniref:Bet1-like protein n=1 Tax=Gossypium australe TaxID=47621 RepID=A0A5B6VY93_9ROSI|nr:bet1-like protein [Gossypium australe]
MANPYRSSQGLSARPVGNSDEIQLRIDPVHADLDEEISVSSGFVFHVWHIDGTSEGKRAAGTKFLMHFLFLLIFVVIIIVYVAQEIETEARIQNEFVSDLQMLMNRAQAGVKSGMTKLNRTVAQQRSNHILQVIIFGLTCFSILYLWSKHFKR